MENTENKETVTVSARIHAPLKTVWECWTEPAHITRWNFASDDWHSPSASNDLRMGGSFSVRMEAKDGSAGFDFGGVYTDVREHAFIAYTMEDGRRVSVEFSSNDGITEVTEVFDPENMHPVEMQQAGWQSILDNFKKYAESQA